MNIILVFTMTSLWLSFLFLFFFLHPTSELSFWAPPCVFCTFKESLMGKQQYPGCYPSKRKSGEKCQTKWKYFFCVRMFITNIFSSFWPLWHISVSWNKWKEKKAFVMQRYSDTSQNPDFHKILMSKCFHATVIH